MIPPSPSPSPFRTYSEVTGGDTSGLLEQVLRQRSRVAERLSTVRHVVAVISGKGGVGKSFVAGSLARDLAQRAFRVGVVDADLQSPTIARMLGATGPLVVEHDGVIPARGEHDVRVISMDLLLDDSAPLRFSHDPGESHTWRSVAENGALREFLSDVKWGALDALIVDMPPDAQRLSDLKSLVPNLAGAIAVTIPSLESRRSVARAMHVARDLGIPLLGIVENMSGYACDVCHDVRPLFSGDAGASLAHEFDVPLLAMIPFAPSGDALLDSRVHDLVSRLTRTLALTAPMRDGASADALAPSSVLP
jgi:ATP-binding protein involved in chromosome partitioning